MFHRSLSVCCFLLAVAVGASSLQAQGTSFTALEDSSADGPGSSATTLTYQARMFCLQVNSPVPGEWIVAIPKVSVVLESTSLGTQADLDMLVGLLPWLSDDPIDAVTLANALAPYCDGASINALETGGSGTAFRVDPQFTGALIALTVAGPDAIRSCGQVALSVPAGATVPAFKWTAKDYPTWIAPVVSPFEVFWNETLSPIGDGIHDLDADFLARETLLYQFAHQFGPSTEAYVDALMDLVVDLGLSVKTTVTPFIMSDSAGIVPGATAAATGAFPSIGGTPAPVLPTGGPSIRIGSPVSVTFIPGEPIDPSVPIPNVISWPAPLPSIYPFLSGDDTYIYLESSSVETITAHYFDFTAGTSGTFPVTWIDSDIVAVDFPASFNGGFVHFTDSAGTITPTRNAWSIQPVPGILVTNVGTAQ